MAKKTSSQPISSLEYISVRGAKEHNLKNVDVDIPRNQFVVVTGLSGSGKSSLAFDTVYAEGQRRYVESLSAYARQFLEMQDKPDVESIEGLSPAIAIDQKTTSRNPRSTVATVTEIYDYMRLLFARVGVPYSPATGKPIERQTVSDMTDHVLSLPKDTKIYLMAPIVRGAKGEHRKELIDAKKQGYARVKIDEIVYPLDDLPVLDKQKKHTISVVIDRIKVSDSLGNRLPDSIETCLRLSNGLMEVEIVDLPEGDTSKHKNGEVILFSERFSCPESGFQLAEIEPRIFSFNSPYGACTACDGMGNEMFFDPETVIPNKFATLKEGAIAPWSASTSKYYEQTLEGLAKHFNFDLDTAFVDLPQKAQDLLLYGSKDEHVPIEYEDGYRIYTVDKPFEGIIPNMERRWRESDSSWVREEMEKYQNITNCRVCHGYRLKPEVQCIKIAEKHIGEVCSWTIEEAMEWIIALPEALNKTQNTIAERILRELKRRIQFLYNVGLDYLTLSRKAGTLSGGEAQRIRLASQIGAGLSGVLYVLDEPSIGLHQRDNDKLINTLKGLKDLGNTVIVVEHDEDTMRQADHIIDVGVGAGVHGGHIIAEGTLDDISKNKKSITGQYLCGQKYIAIPKRREANLKRAIHIQGARANNLKNIDATIPLKTFCAVTGVSGGGKSSLVIHTLYRALSKKLHHSKKPVGEYDGMRGLQYIDKVIEIDQSPIGRTPRSNPATYTGAFTHIRDWFVSLPEAKARGYKPGRFSFNVKGGRCETCRGDGLIKIEMHFLPDVYVKCDACNGKRYNRETLEIKYKDKSIADVLEMTVEDALGFFQNMPHIHEKLAALHEVGLSYITLGQSATTLSGGEAQRVKLAKELSRKSTGRTFYILDEPTTGLHVDDISKLLKVLHKLVDQGNSVLTIEHNLDVIKTADWVIDIGPEGGAKGGYVVATGTPEDIAKVTESYTGRYLKPLLENGVAEAA